MNTNRFLVTYKKLGKNDDVTELTYNSCIAKLKRGGEIIFDNFEVDSKGKLHYHALWVSKRNDPFIKGYVMRGFNTDFRLMYDEESAKKYITKVEGKRTNQQREAAEYFATHHAWSVAN